MLGGIEDAIQNGVDDGPTPCCGACTYWMEFIRHSGCGLCCFNWSLSEDCTTEDVNACTMDEWNGPCHMYEEG